MTQLKTKQVKQDILNQWESMGFPKLKIMIIYKKTDEWYIEWPGMTKTQSGRPIHFLNNFIQFSMQYITTIKTSRLQMFFEIGVLKVCNVLRKRLELESLFSKVVSLEVYKFVKKKLQHRCFPLNITTLLRNVYLKNTTRGFIFSTWTSPGIWL